MIDICCTYISFLCDGTVARHMATFRYIGVVNKLVIPRVEIGSLTRFTKDSPVSHHGLSYWTGVFRYYVKIIYMQ